MRNTSYSPARLLVLSQTGEHALRAVLFLARQQEGRFVPATEIADALGAPRNYLGKTLRLLARRGLLRSVRGAQGGFRLRRPADSISAAEVIEAVDDVPPMATCLLGDHPCQPDRPCEVHPHWSALRERVLAPLAETSIADLLGPPVAPTPSTDSNAL
jgi:Rrf2 family protein